MFDFSDARGTLKVLEACTVRSFLFENPTCAGNQCRLIQKAEV